MAFVPLAPVATGDLATAALHNTLLENTNWLEAQRVVLVGRDSDFDSAFTVIDGRLDGHDTNILSNTNDITALNALITDIQSGTHELYIPIGAFRPHLTNGPGPVEDVTMATAGHYMPGMPFDPTSVESCSFAFAMPKSWNEGTITFQVYTFNTAGGSGDFVFTLYPMARSDGESINTSGFGTGSVTDSAGAARDLTISAVSSALTVGSTPAVGDLIWFVFGRTPTDGADTYASDVYVTGVKLRLVVDDTEDD